MEKRLQTVLSHAGVASRRSAAELIEDGKVKVDGKVVTERGFRLDPESHSIQVSGRYIDQAEKKYYFIFNKPEGIISTARDTHGRRKVNDFFRSIDARLYTVGRLDKDTTGVLLVTNDGELTNRLSHPRYNIEKEYWVKLSGYLKKPDLEKLTGGVEVEGKMTSKCRIVRLGRESGIETVKVVIHEGRKRQIKKMFETVGLKVTALKRTVYAGMKLGRLKEGEYRELRTQEVVRLKRLVRAESGRKTR